MGINTEIGLLFGYQLKDDEKFINFLKDKEESDEDYYDKTNYFLNYNGIKLFHENNEGFLIGKRLSYMELRNNDEGNWPYNAGIKITDLLKNKEEIIKEILLFLNEFELNEFVQSDSLDIYLYRFAN